MRTAVLIYCAVLGFATLVNAKSFDRHALVIGIADYKTFPADQRLKYADRDAKQFSAFIKTTEGGGFKEENIHVLINAGATRSNIFKEINVLSKLVETGDLVYIFFAGHGVLDETDAAFLMPVDAVLTDPNAMGIRADDFLREIRRKISAKYIIFFLDACHSAAAINHGSARSTSGLANEIQKSWAEAFQDRPGTTMGFFSAASNERSWEDDSLQQGVFTYYLIKALSGEADSVPLGNSDGKVTAGELRTYLVENVSRHTRANFSVQQTPTVTPVFDSELVLSFMAFRKASELNSADRVPNDHTVVNLVPTQNSMLLNDPTMDLIRSELVRYGLKLVGWPAHPGYSVVAPNGAMISFYPFCMGGTVTYFHPGVKEQADLIAGIVAKHTNGRRQEPRYIDPDSFPREGTYIWLQQLIHLGKLHIEVCFGVK